MPAPGFPAAGYRAWLPAGLLLLGVTGVLLAAALFGKMPASRSGTVAAVFHVGAPDDLSSSGPPAAERRKDSLYRQTQANLIKTRPVLEEALRQPAVAGLDVVRAQANPLAWLERDLRVDVNETTRTIRISLPGDRPAELARVVNAVAHAYLKEVVAPERRQQLARLADCERVLKENQEAIQKRLTEIQAAGRRGLEDRSALNIQYQMALERSASVQKEIEAATSKKEKAELQLAFARKKLQGAATEKVTDAMVEEQLERDAFTQQLRTQRAKLRRTLEQYENVGRDSPRVATMTRGYRDDLKDIEKQLARRRDDIRERLERQLRQQSKYDAEQKMAQLTEDVELAKEELKQLQQRRTEQAQEVQKHARNPWAEIELLLKDIERKEEVVKTFATECEALRQEILAAPRVTLVQEAGDPEP